MLRNIIIPTVHQIMFGVLKEGGIDGRTSNNVFSGSRPRQMYIVSLMMKTKMVLETSVFYISDAADCLRGP
jgi:hypothetical protein